MEIKHVVSLIFAKGHAKSKKIYSPKLVKGFDSPFDQLCTKANDINPRRNLGFLRKITCVVCRQE